jgi:hypothetical protein
MKLTFSAIVDHPRIICVQIKLAEERRAPELATSADRNLTRIQVNRMRQILTDRNPDSMWKPRPS